MTGNQFNGDRNWARSGAQALALLASPINVAILDTLTDGPQRQSELRRAAGSPAQTTLRTQLETLTQVGVLERHRRNGFPGVVACELTASGQELLFVLDVLRHWLERASEGAVDVGSNEAKAAIKALVEGWSTAMLRALAAAPLSLTELDRIISPLSYPTLERRLAALRLAGQVEARAREGRSTPYALTAWGREAVGPLAASARWERRNLSISAAPIRRLDAEAMFLLAAPLLRPATKASGSCRMAMELSNGNGRRLAGVIVAVENGHVRSCTSRLRSDADAWALGSPTAWLEAIAGADPAGIESGGDGNLARSLLDAFHCALFGPR